jgi:hypothetical protein
VLGEVLTTPSYGYYCQDPEAGEDETYYLWDYDATTCARGEALYIAPGEGRRAYSRYDLGTGYNYWLYPVEAGQFWAYYAAIIMLTSSTGLNVRGADVGADFLSYSIPPYLVFENEITRMFNGLFLQNNSIVAPRVVQQDGSLTLERRLFTALDPFQNGELIDPETGFGAESVMDSVIGADDGPTVDVMTGFTQRYLPALYGMAFFDSNYSIHFHDQAKIYRLGSGETITAGEGFEVVQYCDTETNGICYAAVMPAGEGVEGGDPPLAARLIIETQRLHDEDPEANRFAINDNIEMMNMLRGMYEVFGNSMN